MSKRKKFKTTFLTPNHNIWTGVGTIFNISGNYYEFNYSKSDKEADRKAIESDWEAVGEDIKNAILNSSNKQISALV